VACHECSQTAASLGASQRARHRLEEVILALESEIGSLKAKLRAKDTDKSALERVKTERRVFHRMAERP